MWLDVTATYIQRFVFTYIAAAAAKLLFFFDQILLYIFIFFLFYSLLFSVKALIDSKSRQSYYWRTSLL